MGNGFYQDQARSIPTGLRIPAQGFPTLGKRVNPLQPLINQPCKGCVKNPVVAHLYATHSGLKFRGGGGGGVYPGLGNPGLKYGILQDSPPSYALRAPVTPEVDTNFQSRNSLNRGLRRVPIATC